MGINTGDIWTLEIRADGSVKKRGEATKPKLRSVVARNEQYIVIHTKGHTYTAGARGWGRTYTPATTTVYKIYGLGKKTKDCELVMVEGLFGCIEWSPKPRKTK